MKANKFLLNVRHARASGAPIETFAEDTSEGQHTANGRIAYRFHARDLHLVMGPAARGTAVRFRVGYEVFRSSPRQADLMIVAGTVSIKMGPRLRLLCYARNRASSQRGTIPYLLWEWRYAQRLTCPRKVGKDHSMTPR